MAVEGTEDGAPMIGIIKDPSDERSWYWNGTDWFIEKYYDYMIRAVVGKVPTAITCLPSSNTVAFRSNVTVSGSIDLPCGVVEVELNYVRPNGTIAAKTVVTVAKGRYADVLYPDSIGLWSVSASWAGDEIYSGAQAS